MTITAADGAPAVAATTFKRDAVLMGAVDDARAAAVAEAGVAMVGDHLGVNEWHAGRCRSSMQVMGPVTVE